MQGLPQEVFEGVKSGDALHNQTPEEASQSAQRQEEPRVSTNEHLRYGRNS